MCKEYGNVFEKYSAQPESNQRPRDINCMQLQSPALPTELYADFWLIKQKNGFNTTLFPGGPPPQY